MSVECPFVNDFKKGDDDKNNQILLMQQFLFNKNETADGIFDDVTVDVLKEFKRKYGLGNDGIFDEKTRNFVCSSLGFVKDNNFSGTDIGIRINVDLSSVCTTGMIKLFEYNAGEKDAPVHKISAYVTYPNNEKVTIFQGADLLGLESMQEKAYLLPLKGIKNGKVEIILDEDNLLKEENLENNIFYFELDCPDNDIAVEEEKEEEQEQGQGTAIPPVNQKSSGSSFNYTPKNKDPKPPVEKKSGSSGSTYEKPEGDIGTN
ncbi:MAG: peptidoglycan-binding domain-containing protein [Candidatus Pacebacteria bacterium]|nr:peptidoglycan-binding domain-containing protein [Candidatus Paceibacterota bacterium]